MFRFLFLLLFFACSIHLSQAQLYKYPLITSMEEAIKLPSKDIEHLQIDAEKDAQYLHMLNGFIHTYEITIYNLKKFPDPVPHFTSAQRLNFSGTFTTMPESGYNMWRSLRHLRINAPITTLPEGLSKLFFVENLVLNRCKLTQIPTCILEWKELKRIYMDENPLETISPDIEKLTKLKELSCRHCKISSLPETIGKLPVLDMILLEDNNLTSLPIGLTTSKSIKSLELSKNKIRSLPKEIGNMLQLESLSIDQNPINELPIEVVYLNRVTIYAVGTGIKKSYIEKLYKATKINMKEQIFYDE